MLEWRTALLLVLPTRSVANNGAVSDRFLMQTTSILYWLKVDASSTVPETVNVSICSPVEKWRWNFPVHSLHCCLQWRQINGIGSVFSVSAGWRLLFCREALSPLLYLRRRDDDFSVTFSIFMYSSNSMLILSAYYLRHKAQGAFMNRGGVVIRPPSGRPMLAQACMRMKRMTRVMSRICDASYANSIDYD